MLIANCYTLSLSMSMSIFGVSHHLLCPINYSSMFNQLVRQTSLSTLVGDSDARFLLTIFPDRPTENKRSYGTVVAGVARYSVAYLGFVV